MRDHYYIPSEGHMLTGWQFVGECICWIGGSGLWVWLIWATLNAPGPR